MNESGTTPPDWDHLLQAAGIQGASILRGLAASVAGTANGRDAPPIFIDAWQRALDGEPADPEATAERFSESVQAALHRMRTDTRASVAALDGALRGLRGGTTDAGGWLAAGFRTAHHQRETASGGDALVGALEHYMDALTDHHGELSRAVENGLAAFHDELARRRQAQEQPLELTELHSLWIESAEPAYEAVLNSGEYTRAFARVHNAAMELAEALQAYARPFLEALGLPSREELEAVQRQMGELRRERNRSRRLEAEVTMLRQEVDALRAELRSSPDTHDRH